MTVRSVVALLVVACVGAGAYLLWPSEERKVQKRLLGLADAVSVPPHEEDLARLARAQRVRRWLRDDITVRFEDPGQLPITGRDTVAGLVARPWPDAAAGLTVELQDLAIEIAGDGTSADARFKARVVSPERSDEPATLDGRMVALTLQRVNGEWLVASARVMRRDDSIR